MNIRLIFLGALLGSVTKTIGQQRNFTIDKTWNGQEIRGKAAVTVTLAGVPGSKDIALNISAPFFDDPSPSGTPGQPFLGLWDYEVVEVFFLNDEDQYLEVEVGPYGHHIVLLLAGERNTIRHSLPMEVTTTRGKNLWQGYAVIPGEYFPPNVTKFNAYAIHGVGESRTYWSLYPADGTTTSPDFHNLKFFRPIDMSSISPGGHQQELSTLWQSALHGMISYTLDTQWNGQPSEVGTVTVTLQGLQVGVEVNFTARNDVRFFPLREFTFVFENEKGEALRVRLFGNERYIVNFLKNRNEILNKEAVTLDYRSTEVNEVTQGSLLIPPEYFPPNVKLLNGFAVFGIAVLQVIPIKPVVVRAEELAIKPELDSLDHFIPIDFDRLVVKNNDYSAIWTEFDYTAPLQLRLDEAKGSVTDAAAPESHDTSDATETNGPNALPIKTSTEDRDAVEAHQADAQSSTAMTPTNGQDASEDSQTEGQDTTTAVTTEGGDVEAASQAAGQTAVLMTLNEGHIAAQTEGQDRTITSQVEGQSVIPSSQADGQDVAVESQADGQDVAVESQADGQDVAVESQAESEATSAAVRGESQNAKSSPEMEVQNPTQITHQNGDQKSDVNETSTDPIHSTPHHERNVEIKETIEETSPTDKMSDSSSSQREIFQRGIEDTFSDRNILPITFKISIKSQPQLDDTLQRESETKTSLSEITEEEEKEPLDISVTTTTGRDVLEVTDAISQFLDMASPDTESIKEQSSQTQYPATESQTKQFPDIKSPDMQSPGMQSPDIQSPDMQSPDIQSPDIQSPDMQSPDIQSPDMQSPDMRSPDMQSPDMQSPHIEEQSSDAEAPDTLPLFGESSDPEYDTDLLPPPHPICFNPGLVPDRYRCQVFYECVLENGVWEVYSWRCKRGYFYDPERVACLRGFC